MKHLDKKAGTRDPAKTWSHPYDYFWLTRYPRLQPQDDPIGKKTYQDHLTGQERRILAHPEAERALATLSEDRRREVVALVFDWTLHFQEHVKWTEQLKRLGTLARQSARLTRFLESQQRQLKKSFEKVVSTDSTFDPELGGGQVRAALRRSYQQLEAAKPAMSSEDYRRLRDATKDSRYYQTVADDLIRLAMVQFFWLFRHGCGLLASESEVRVALIRNSLWSKYVGSVTLTVGPPEEPGEAPGCDAVRKAVVRFRLKKGTLPKISR